MFRLSKKRKRLFYKYLLSYMIIFLIPYITISAVFYQMSVNNLREEIIQSNIEKLEQVRDLTDERVRELENIALRISLDHRLTPYMLKDPYFSKQAIQELNTYQVNSSVIDGLYLYYHGGEDQIYSQRGIGTFDTLTNGAYRITKNASVTLRENMKAVSHPTVRPITLRSGQDQMQNRLISFVYPIPPNSTTPYGTVTFFVKEETLTKLTQNVLGDFKGSIYIFNGEYELLASSSRGKSLNPGALENVSLAGSGVITERIDDEEHSLVTVRSKVSDWTFVTAMPTAQFYNRMTNLKILILAILAVIALLGAATAVLMSFRQYKPIQNLSQFINMKQSAASPKKMKKDELDNIRETVESIYEDREQLYQKMRVQQPFVRDQFLLKLLNGNPTIQVEVEEMLNDLNIAFTGKRFFIVMISFKEKIREQKSLQSRERLLKLLNEVSFHGCTGYGVELIHENAVALIVNMNDQINNGDEEQRRFGKALTQLMKKHSQTMPTIGVGTIYEGIAWLNRSFIEATACIDYALLNNQDHAVYFEEVTAQSRPSFWYPEEYKVKFEQSLKQGDRVVAKETLKNILNNLMEKETSAHMLRCMSFDVINTVLKNISHLRLIHSVDDVKALAEFRSLEDLERKLSILIVKICKEVDRRKESHNIRLRDDILGYIHQQYKTYQLSLERTAEVFQLSSSYLSRFMKEQTGSTFTEYVWKLRVEEFKRRLKETNDPIKHIVKDIGYVDVANFTRKFKKEVGITPGQYREYYSYDNSGESLI